MSSVEFPDVVDVDLLKEKAYGREWFHTIDLGHGVVTPGIDATPAKLELMRFPESLVGKTVLDIGAYDGFFSFEAERRGAERVVAADSFCWSLTGMGDGQGFEIARWALESKVEKQVLTVEEISPETVGTFDVVLFLGVLYHAPDPLGYLRRVFSVCTETAIIETQVDALDYDKPVMVFYPGDSLYGDPSNYWGPNRRCVEEMLVDVGFTSVEMVGAEGARMVFHAHR